MTEPTFTTQELNDLVKGGNDFAIQIATQLLAAEATIKAQNDALEKVRDTAHRISQWCAAYPLDIFPEPDFKLARKGLKSVGITMDAVSASNMRHVLKGITGYAKELESALKPLED